MTKAGGSNDRVTAKSITSDVADFFHATSQSSKHSFCNIDRLLNRSNLELFAHYIKHIKEYKPAVICEKLQRLKLAIHYIMNACNSKDYCTSGWSLLDLLTDLQQPQKSKAMSPRPVESVYNELVGIYNYSYMYNCTCNRTVSCGSAWTQMVTS